MGMTWHWHGSKAAFTQVCLVGLICFCCPGMFNALNGMGAGGQEDPRVANNSLTALYAFFALFGLLGGGLYNVCGPRLTLFAGCLPYVLYVASYLYYNVRADKTTTTGSSSSSSFFVVVAGAILGIGAGLLWAAQGAIITSYPNPSRKGRFISLFWTIFNLGAVLGAFIPFALNFRSENSGRVTNATYIAFMCVMSLGTLLTLLLSNPDSVVRDDGTRVRTHTSHEPLPSTSNPSLFSALFGEFIQVSKLLVDWRMLLLAPSCFASNFFYTYQFNNVNAALFDVRTRAFNNVFYWGAQMGGSIMMGYVLDKSHKRRRIRGLLGCGILATVGMAIWGGGFANQLRYSRARPFEPKLDFTLGRPFVGPFALYVTYGLLDAMYQTLCYWTIGAISSEPDELSRYSGFYKGVQSAGAAIAWHIDNTGVSFVGELLINWVLMGASFPLLAILLTLTVKEDGDGGDPCESGLQHHEMATIPSKLGDATNVPTTMAKE